MNVPNAMFPNQAQWGQPPPVPQEQAPVYAEPEPEEVDNARRPPNAFILYTMSMRTKARQENPSLSNTEISSLLGKWWKEVPNDVKLRYKQQAAELQEKFKKEHPDYTYRKARRKRALNELLSKSSSSFGVMPFGPPMMQGHEGMQGQFQMMPGNFPLFGQQPAPIDPNAATQQAPAENHGINPLGSIGQISGQPVNQQFGFPQSFGMQFGIQQQMFPSFQSSTPQAN